MNIQPGESKYMTMKEIAAMRLAPVGYKVLLRWAHRGMGVKINGRYYATAVDVRQWMKENGGGR